MKLSVICLRKHIFSYCLVVKAAHSGTKDLNFPPCEAWENYLNSLPLVEENCAEKNKVTYFMGTVEKTKFSLFIYVKDVEHGLLQRSVIYYNTLYLTTIP